MCYNCGVQDNTPRKKRKYTKKSKMLLRSNYDYIDHEYWPRMYAKQKEISERMKKKRPELYPVVPKPAIEPEPEIRTRKLTPEELLQMEIDSCQIFGITCSKHKVIHKKST